MSVLKEEVISAATSKSSEIYEELKHILEVMKSFNVSQPEIKNVTSSPSGIGPILKEAPKDAVDESEEKGIELHHAFERGLPFFQKWLSEQGFLSTEVSSKHFNCFIHCLLQHALGQYQIPEFKDTQVSEIKNKAGINANLVEMRYSDTPEALKILKAVNEIYRVNLEVHFIQINQEGQLIILEPLFDVSISKSKSPVIVWQQPGHYVSIVSQKLKQLYQKSSLNSSPVLPQLGFDRERLQKIIDKINLSQKSKEEIDLFLDSIQKKVLEINSCQSEEYVEDFYWVMQFEIQEIRNIANHIFELIKDQHQVLPNRLMALVQVWISPLENELKRLEVPEDERKMLELKTKYLYAEQSYILRTSRLQLLLKEYLGKLKELFIVPGKPNPCCYISYAWPSEKQKNKEYWVQPFLSGLYDHLNSAGIRMVMDIRDNKPGESIILFMKRYKEGNPIILIGTESLLEKHYSISSHAVKTELTIINDCLERDQKQLGRSRVYPMLISGSSENAFPEIYDKYKTIRDGRKDGYIGAIKELIDWIYEEQIKKNSDKFIQLSNAFYREMVRLPLEYKAVEEELTFEYHRSRLSYLKQDRQYQDMQVQQEAKCSPAVGEKLIGVLLESQGSNLKRLYDESGEQYQRPYNNEDFVERVKIQENIEAYFAKSEKQILTLTTHGLGGVGKTELAQQFYLHPPRPYALRAWFYAESREKLCQQYVIFGENRFSFSEKESLEEKAKRVKQWLERQKDCLLIYDNVPGINVVEGLLPEQGKHHILITSRNEVDWLAHQKLDIEVMDESEAIALICKIVGIDKNDDNLKKLVKMLGYLPLALAQAAAYISVKSLKIEDYLILYQQHQEILLSEKTTRAPKHEPVWVTFNMSFEALKEECPEALQTLKRASWVSYAAIPEVLLKEMISENLKNLPMLWGNIKEAVKKFSLMRIDVKYSYMAIHPLIQDILREKQKGNKEDLTIFNKVYESINILLKNYGVKDLVGHKALLSHSESVHQYAKTFIQRVEERKIEDDFFLLATEPVELGSTYLHLGLYKQAQNFHRHVLNIYEKFYGKISPHLITPLVNLGLSCGGVGDVNARKDLLERALAIHAETRMNEDEGYAGILMNLGNVYGLLGDAEKKISFLKKALKIQKMLSKSDLDITRTLFNLGQAYGVKGNLNKQVELQTMSLNILEREYGPEHPEVANVLGSLSNAFSESGDYDKQFKLISRSLKIYEKEYGKEHPLFANGLHSLANAYGNLRKPQEKKEKLEEALAIKEKYFGKNHIETASVLSSLGNAHGALGNAEKHIEFSERALKIEQDYYKKDTLEIAHTLLGLSSPYGVLGKIDKKKYALERAISIYRKFYIKDNHVVADALVGLSEVHNILGDHEEQKKLAEAALRILEEHYGADHTGVVDALSSIALACGHLGEVQRKSDLLEKVLKIQEKHLKENDPDIAITLNNLALAKGMLGKVKEERGLVERALKIFKEFYGEKHPQYAQGLVNLSNVYRGLVRQKELLKEALEILKNSFGNNHSAVIRISKGLEGLEKPDAQIQIIKSISNMGTKFYNNDQLDEALEEFSAALAVCKESKSAADEATACYNIGSIYFRKKQYDKANPYLESAYSQRLKLFTPYHEATQKAQSRLRECESKLNETLPSSSSKLLG